ncbi:hypothetical protein BDR04DRAFT_1118913 [Suillus decipiens]|nr:hypothetical protein BDR04DRAFT_1118913 [Suillus decipiens]
MFPLRFIFGKDKETSKLYPFEQEVIWDIILGVVLELKYQHYITDLNNLFCTAATAVCRVLEEFSQGILVDIKFLAHTFKSIYNGLKDYIQDHIYTDPELSKR